MTMSNARLFEGIIVSHNNPFLELVRALEVAATRHQVLKERLGYVPPGTYIRFTWEFARNAIEKPLDQNGNVRFTCEREVRY